jgi:integrase
VVTSALGSAVKRRLVPWNVCQQVEQPAERSEPRPVWDAAQVRLFLDSVSHDRLAALWRIYCLAGVRRGEGLGLSWDSVDLDCGEFRVVRTLGEVGSNMVWGTPKTAKGMRTVAIDPGTVSAPPRSQRPPGGREAGPRRCLSRSGAGVCCGGWPTDMARLRYGPLPSVERSG